MRSPCMLFISGIANRVQARPAPHGHTNTVEATCEMVTSSLNLIRFRPFGSSNASNKSCRLTEIHRSECSERRDDADGAQDGYSRQWSKRETSCHCGGGIDAASKGHDRDRGSGGRRESCGNLKSRAAHLDNQRSWQEKPPCDGKQAGQARTQRRRRLPVMAQLGRGGSEEWTDHNCCWRTCLRKKA